MFSLHVSFKFHKDPLFVPPYFSIISFTLTCRIALLSCLWCWEVKKSLKRENTLPKSHNPSLHSCALVLHVGLRLACFPILSLSIQVFNAKNKNRVSRVDIQFGLRTTQSRAIQFISCIRRYVFASQTHIAIYRAVISAEFPRLMHIQQAADEPRIDTMRM